MRNKRTCAWALSAALAALGTLGACLYLRHFGPGEAAAFALAVVCGWYTLAGDDRRLRGFSLAFGGGFALCLLLGLRLDEAGTLGGEGALWVLAASAGYAPGAGALFALAARSMGRARLSARSGMSERRFFALAFAGMMLCWLPCFLAFYPGVFSYDVGGQVMQGVKIPYRTDNPLFHTLLVNGLYRIGRRLGDVNIGVAAYSVCQMSAMAAALAFSASTLRRAGCRTSVCLAGLALAALLPMHAVLSVSTTKDPLFAAFALFLITFLFRGVRWPETRKKSLYWLGAASSAALLCLARNNGWCVLGIALLLGLLFCFSACKRAMCAVLAGLMLFGGISAGLQAALHPQHWKTSEVMSVPVQQMARVVTLHPEWAEDAEVQALFIGEIKYNPSLSDPVKFIFRKEGNTPISRAIRLWTRMLVRYPTEYVDAFAYLTRGWWDVRDTSHSVIYGDDDGYMHTNVLPDYGVERRSLWPALEKLYIQTVTDNGYQRVPVYRLLFAPALWVWLLVLLTLLAFYLREREVALLCFVPLGVALTMLLGPCCLVRYVYPVMLCVPALWGMLRTRAALRREN